MIGGTGRMAGPMRTACAAIMACWSCPTCSKALGYPVSFSGQGNESVRAQTSAFQFMAEVYWDRKWTMQQQGFAYTYDTAVRTGSARARRPVREHFLAGLDYQDKMARFLENHDELGPRHVLCEVHERRPSFTFLSPGLRFFSPGTVEGRRSASPHLGRLRRAC